MAESKGGLEIMSEPNPRIVLCHRLILSQSLQLMEQFGSLQLPKRAVLLLSPLLATLLSIGSGTCQMMSWFSSLNWQKMIKFLLGYFFADLMS